MNDDFFILKLTQPDDLLLNRGKMKDIVSYYHKIHNSLTPYDRNVENAYKELKSMGFEEPISFELHCSCGAKELFKIPVYTKEIIYEKIHNF